MFRSHHHWINEISVYTTTRWCSLPRIKSRFHSVRGQKPTMTWLFIRLYKREPCLILRSTTTRDSMTEHRYHNLAQPHAMNSPEKYQFSSESCLVLKSFGDFRVVQNQHMKISSILGLDERRTSDSSLSYLAFESSGQSATLPLNSFTWLNVFWIRFV